MKLWSESFQNGGWISASNAFAEVDPAVRIKLSANRNPHLAWDDVPNGTESLVLFCIDGDAPSDGRDVNQEGRSVALELPRADFFHWSLIDIPPFLKGIDDGQMSNQVTPRGKPGPRLAFTAKDGVEHQLRHGLNDYTAWFAGDAQMAGNYYGYDGPCPPWNDLRVHHYIFRLYALDVPCLALEGAFTGQQACEAIHGHILDEAQLIGAYTLNPGASKI